MEEKLVRYLLHSLICTVRYAGMYSLLLRRTITRQVRTNKHKGLPDKSVVNSRQVLDKQTFNLILANISFSSIICISLFTKNRSHILLIAFFYCQVSINRNLYRQWNCVYKSNQKHCNFERLDRSCIFLQCVSCRDSCIELRRWKRILKFPFRSKLINFIKKFF